MKLTSLALDWVARYWALLRTSVAPESNRDRLARHGQPLIALALIIAAFASPVMGQEHSHEGALGKFYERWMMPGPRTVSCCNRQDCAPVEHVRRFNGELQFQRKRDGQWLTIPPEKLESNFDDAYDSPDGFSHMCSNFNNVYCAVLGSGI